MLQETITGTAIAVTVALGADFTTTLIEHPWQTRTYMCGRKTALARGYDADIQLLAGTAIEIKNFPFDGRIIELDPPFQFPASLQDDIWEVCGEGLYASVIVQAPNISGIINELRTDIFPFLWQEYAQKDDVNMSLDARALKADLLQRASG